MGPIEEPPKANYRKQMDETRTLVGGLAFTQPIKDQTISIESSWSSSPDQIGSAPFRVIDFPYSKVEHREMNGLTREELDAKLDARDSKADARMSRFEERIEQAIGEMRRDSSRFEQSVKDLQSEIRSSQKSTISLVIGSALAIFFGIAGVNYSLFSVFDSGRETGAAIEKATSKLDNVVEEIKKDYQNTQKKMDELESKISKPAP